MKFLSDYEGDNKKISEQSPFSKSPLAYGLH